MALQCSPWQEEKAVMGSAQRLYYAFHVLNAHAMVEIAMVRLML